MKKTIVFSLILGSLLINAAYLHATEFCGSGLYSLQMPRFVAAGGPVCSDVMQLDGVIDYSNACEMRSSMYSVISDMFVQNNYLPLELSIFAPASGIHTKDSIVMIEGAVNQTGVVVSINSLNVALNNKEFNCIYPLAFDENLITIRAEKDGRVIDKVISIYRDVGQITTAEDMLMSVERNFGKLYDLEATLISSDMYHNEPLLGSLWSKIYFKSPDSIRLESYADESRIEEYSLFVLNDTMLYNRGKDRIVHETDLCVFANVASDKFEQLNIPFDVEAFMAGHEFTLETFNESSQIGWLTAVPQTFSDIYSKIRLQINCAQGTIRVMELFINDVLAERNEVVDVITINDVVVPKTIRKTTYLPIGDYISDYVLEDITINQGLGDGLFFLS